MELISQADYDQAGGHLRSGPARRCKCARPAEQGASGLEKTTIVSPMNGVVISREVDVGQTVAAS